MAKTGGLIDILEWDTEHIGLKTGRINNSRFLAGKKPLKNLNRLDREAKKTNLQYLLGRFDLSSWGTALDLTEHGFRLLDIILKWKLPSPEIKAVPPTKSHVREFIISDLKDVMRISARSFIFDRYHADRIIDMKKADRLHAEWIRNSCLNPDCRVFIAVINKKICGFISVKMTREKKAKIGVIDLIAVDVRYRKLGVGRDLVNQALLYMKRTVDVVEVGTQLINVPAWKLYQEVGFKLDTALITVRSHAG